MIKFNCLIHKETGVVIKYEEWICYAIGRCEIKIINQKGDNEYYKGTFNAIDILFNDDFEIIYDSEFTTKELIEIIEDRCGFDTETKINKLIKKREFNRFNYGIEV